MPEGPEVQTIVNDLRLLIKNKTLNSVELLDDILKKKGIQSQLAKLNNRIVKDVYRLGKYIIIDLDNYKLAIHLRMTGSLVSVLNKYTRAILYFEDIKLYFNDIRRFGTVEIFSDHDEFKKLKNLGEDILDITEEAFIKVIKTSKKDIYTTLLNNKYITGIGNIYANEILHDTNINPYIKVNNLSELDLKSIFKSAQTILNDSVNKRGTSFSDYVDLAGKAGQFQNYLKVYRQNNKNCIKCNQQIIKDKIAGRSIFYCPNCQK